MANVIAGTVTQATVVPADIAVNTSGYTEIGSYTILQGEQIAFGQGLLTGRDNSIGRAYAKFQTSAAANVAGYLRIMITDMNDVKVADVFELHTSVLNLGASDPRQRYPLPLQKRNGAGFGRKIKFYFKADSAATISAADCTVALDVTRKYV